MGVEPVHVEDASYESRRQRNRVGLGYLRKSLLQGSFLAKCLVRKLGIFKGALNLVGIWSSSKQTPGRCLVAQTGQKQDRSRWKQNFGKKEEAGLWGHWFHPSLKDFR